MWVLKVHGDFGENIHYCLIKDKFNWSALTEALISPFHA